jgi:hypothetical protein
MLGAVGFEHGRHVRHRVVDRISQACLDAARRAMRTQKVSGRTVSVGRVEVAAGRPLRGARSPVFPDSLFDWSHLDAPGARSRQLSSYA